MQRPEATHLEGSVLGSLAYRVVPVLLMLQIQILSTPHRPRMCLQASVRERNYSCSVSSVPEGLLYVTGSQRDTW